MAAQAVPTALLSQVGASMAGLESKALQLEDQVRRLSDVARDLDPREVKDSARDLVNVVEAASSELTSCKDQLTGLPPGPQARMAADRGEKLTKRFAEACKKAARLRSMAADRIGREMESLRIEVANSILRNLGGKHKTGEELFAVADKGRNGSLTLEEFISFVNVSNSDVSRQDLTRLFEYLDDDKTNKLRKDDFLRCVCVFYRAARPKVELSETMGISQGRKVRTLEVNEVVELVEGPVTESKTGLVRIRCRAVIDAALGWAPVTGGRMVTFLAQTRIHFKVLVSTAMTSTVKIDGCSTLRMLKEGEMLETLLWERKDQDSGLKRMKFKAVNDGSIGWVSVASNKGERYLEIV